MAYGAENCQLAGETADKGVTALQMDIKITGITEEIMRKALDQAHAGRIHILGEMSKAMTGARTELGEHAPRIVRQSRTATPNGVAVFLRWSDTRSRRSTVDGC